MIGPVEAILVIPALAIPVLALISDYRLGAGLNILACAMTFTAALSLLFTEHPRSDLVIIDDFNIFFIILTTFVGFTTSIFSASYLAHEIEIGRLTPTFLRFYHAMYQALMCAMNVALVANNASGLNLVIAAIVFWNSTYIADALSSAAWPWAALGLRSPWPKRIKKPPGNPKR